MSLCHSEMDKYLAYSIANKFPNVKNISTEQLDSKLDKLQGTSLIIIDAREKVTNRGKGGKYLMFLGDLEHNHLLSNKFES